MIQAEHIVEVFRELLPDGDVVLEDEASIDFSFPIDSKKLKSWVFIIGNEDIIIQIYCVGGTAPEHLPAVRQLITNLNFKIPFGSYQTNDLGVITYRTQCFVETVEQAKFSINKALEYAGAFIEEHLTAIAAVSEGFTSPEAALLQIDANVAAHFDQGQSDDHGTN